MTTKCLTNAPAPSVPRSCGTTRRLERRGGPAACHGTARLRSLSFALTALAFLGAQVPCPAQTRLVYEATSPYHHVRVVDSAGLRTLCFDDATETQMRVANPLQGHFEYTEYFHMGWLWNTNISRVLMIGLGGGSAQRSFEHYYPNVQIDTVEIDPVVVRVAQDYFQLRLSNRQKVHVSDGRMFLRRASTSYDQVILDAYTQGRYGSSLPQHLATREFFELVKRRLTTNGIVAYNVIGTTSGYRANLVGSMYRTMKSVFPQVYFFPARSSQNIVLLATMAQVRAEPLILRQRALQLSRSGQVALPGFVNNLNALQIMPPPNAGRSPILTDDYAPVEGLAAQQ